MSERDEIIKRLRAMKPKTMSTMANTDSLLKLGWEIGVESAILSVMRYCIPKEGGGATDDDS